MMKINKKHSKNFACLILSFFILIFGVLMTVPLAVKAEGSVEAISVDVRARFGVTYTGSPAQQIAEPTGNDDTYMIYCATARYVTITTTHNDPNSANDPAAGFYYMIDHNYQWSYSLSNFTNTHVVYLSAGEHYISVNSARYTQYGSTYTILFT